MKMCTQGNKMHLLIRIALGLIFIYSVYVCGLFLLQRKILFPSNHVKTIPGINHNIPGMEKIWLDTSVGKVEAWFLPPALKPYNDTKFAGLNLPKSAQTTNLKPYNDTKPAPAVIFAHGNAELIDFWPEELKQFTSLGMGLLLVEYPGYGRSQGRPSQKSVTEVFVAAYDTLIAREEIDASRIVLMGRSIGGGAVCALAARRPSAALILMSTLTSVKSFAPRFFVPGFIVRDPFDNLSVVTDYSRPVLVFHGKNDNLIPYDHGVALCRAAKQGKMITYNSGHNDCPPNWDTFWQDVELFLHNAGII